MNFNKDILLQIIVWTVLFTGHILFLTLPPHDINKDILLYVGPLVNTIFLIPISVVFFCVSIFRDHENEDGFYNFMINNHNRLLTLCKACLLVIFCNSSLTSFNTIVKIFNGEISLKINDIDTRVIYSILSGIVVIIISVMIIGYYLHSECFFKKKEETKDDIETKIFT